MITDLMVRQQCHRNKWNQEIFANKNKLNQIQVQVEISPDSWQKTMKLQAAQALSLKSYERFVSHLERTAYLCVRDIISSDGAHCYEVSVTCSKF